MSGATYLGSNKVKKIFINGTKVKKVFLGTTQVFASEFAFMYSGQCMLNGTLCTPNTEYAAEGNFYIKFLTSGTLTVTSLGDNDSGFDLFMIGAGVNGKRGYHNITLATEQYGGDGGEGGYYKNVLSVPIDLSTSITIGSSNGAHSSFGSYSTSTGSTRKTVVGKGAWVHRGDATHQAATSGENGVYAFDDSSLDGIRYGACGGGGGCCGQFSATVHQMRPGSGGTTGGGIGGDTTYWYADPYLYSPGSGVANTGSGGGGNSFHFFVQTGSYNYSCESDIGYGGSGTVILRNHRT